MREEDYGELQTELLNTIGKMRKELLWTRIINSVLIVMMMGFLVFGGIVVSKVQGYAKQAIECVALIEKYMTDLEPMMEQLGKVDVESINNVIAGLDMESINQTLGELDIEAINETLGELDVEAINEAVGAMESTSEKFQNLMEDIKKLFRW